MDKVRRYIYSIITSGPKEPLGFLVKTILVFLSLIYLAVVKIRLKSYQLNISRSKKLRAPVISIGNITWGGTGKTPLVEAVCQHFSSAGRRIAVLTRGYGMDEDNALADNLPDIKVIRGRDRIRNAIAAQAQGTPDLFVLDDGFQHLKIRRDVDIVTINASNPFGNGYLLPAGILREPAAHIRRADLIVITKSNLIKQQELDGLRDKIFKLNPNIQIFEGLHQPLYFYNESGDKLDLNYVREKKICLVSALGDNNSFYQEVKNFCDDIRASFFYMDHYEYTAKEAEKILMECKDRNIDAVITTEKDWVKLKSLLKNIPHTDIEFLILKIKMSICDEKKFFIRLSSLISR